MKHLERVGHIDMPLEELRESQIKTGQEGETFT